jgi:hypothetical protein
LALSYNETREYSVFLSSGEDAHELRELVHALVDDVVNQELKLAQSKVRLSVTAWDRVAAGRALEGETVNDRFVRLARQSSLTLCLLIASLGQGTREEIEAVLDTDDVELSILWFVQRSDPWPECEVSEFLQTVKDVLQFEWAGPPDRLLAAVPIVRVLLHTAFHDLAPSESGEYRERR